jgi:hypothetical protein
MSELMTSIQSPHADRSAGYADWGRKTRAEMIVSLRFIAARNLANAQIILDTPDDEFIVEQYRGAYARSNLKRIEPGPATTKEGE